MCFLKNQEGIDYYKITVLQIAKNIYKYSVQIDDRPIMTILMRKFWDKQIKSFYITLKPIIYKGKKLLDKVKSFTIICDEDVIKCNNIKHNKSYEEASKPLLSYVDNRYYKTYEGE